MSGRHPILIIKGKDVAGVDHVPLMSLTVKEKEVAESFHAPDPLKRRLKVPKELTFFAFPVVQSFEIPETVKPVALTFRSRAASLPNL